MPMDPAEAGVRRTGCAPTFPSRLGCRRGGRPLRRHPSPRPRPARRPVEHHLLPVRPRRHLGAGDLGRHRADPRGADPSPAPRRRPALRRPAGDDHRRRGLSAVRPETPPGRRHRPRPPAPRHAPTLAAIRPRRADPAAAPSPSSGRRARGPDPPRGAGRGAADEPDRRRPRAPGRGRATPPHDGRGSTSRARGGLRTGDVRSYDGSSSRSRTVCDRSPRPGAG